MPNISPGIYTKISDLATYVQEVPSTIGFICALTEKGEDNNLRFVGSRAGLISEWGEPNISKYGKNYGQGMYNAYNFLGEAGSLYFMRCLPDDAEYANMRIDATATDTTATISITYVDALETKAAINTNLVAGVTDPICFLYPIGRGEYYNGLGVRFTSHSNPLRLGVYVMDIYEKQSNGDDVIIESFEVSFNAKATDDAGDSIFLVDILETYSAVLRADMTLASEAFTDGYNLICRDYDKEIGTVSAQLTDGAATITDTKQDFGDWESAAGPATHVVIIMDGKGNKRTGWLGAASGDQDNTVAIYNDRNLTTQDWSEDTTFDADSTLTYVIRTGIGDISDAFPTSEPVPLKMGSDGALIDSSGDLDTSEAISALADGYEGLIDDEVLDTDNIYFSIVFDCGYPTAVKTSISSLVQTRRDCVAILDNGDNATYTASESSREDTYNFNTYFCALYEEYNKVYDNFIGKDMWVSPIYHMSYLLPRNDIVSELWYAAAGFNRATIDSIKELRFNPKLGQRDQMYQRQLNPIVGFNIGHVVWGQLTTQAKASALQDLNIVRLVLYCKRAISDYCKFFIFEQNDAITWGQVAGDITEFLESVKKRRGLYNYDVSVYATEYQKKIKTFSVDIVLNPTRVVEKVELNFFIT